MVTRTLNVIPHKSISTSVKKTTDADCTVWKQCRLLLFCGFYYIEKYFLKMISKRAIW